MGASGNPEASWRECVVDNRRTPIPAQVAFWIDFPRWLHRLSPQNRQAVERLALGYSTSEVAIELRVTRGRITLLRRALADSWHAFMEASNRSGVVAGSEEGCEAESSYSAPPAAEGSRRSPRNARFRNGAYGCSCVPTPVG